MRAPSSPELPASIGRYQVVRLLGEGSMGRVLLARDPVLDRHVALKHLRADLGLPADIQESLLRRMEHEARAAARVTHPNLVVLHDMGEDPQVGVFLVFEFIDGPSLKAQLAAEGRLPAAIAASVARGLGGALARAHEGGVLHRDVKPENVMIARDGAKIADFGIARVPDSTLTHRGGLMGTPAYSAPETFRGGKHSPASDQFSLAATMYEAVSGARAFPGDDAVTVAGRIAAGPPAGFAASIGLPAAVDAVFARALARAPEARFPDCAAFGEALARALVVPSAATLARVADATPAQAPVAPQPPVARRTAQVLLGAAVVVATVALLGRAALTEAPAPPPRLSLSATSSAVPAPSTRYVARSRRTSAPAAAPVSVVRPDAGEIAPAPHVTEDASAPASAR